MPETDTGTKPESSPKTGETLTLEAIRESFGFKPGQNISHVMQGASSAAADAAIKAVMPKVQEMLESVRPKEKPAEPNEAEVLKAKVTDLEARTAASEAARVAAEAGAAEERRTRAVNDVVNGLPVADPLKSAFRTLVVSGNLDGLKAKPTLGSDGSAVVDVAGVPTPLANALQSYLDKNVHWQPNRAVAGGGALGGGNQSMPPIAAGVNAGNANVALGKATTQEEQTAVINGALKAEEAGFVRRIG